jgi:hypothetical protein
MCIVHRKLKVSGKQIISIRKVNKWFMNDKNDKNFFLKALLGAFAKLRKATITFVMSICPSVRLSVPHETTQLPLDEF